MNYAFAPDREPDMVWYKLGHVATIMQIVYLALVILFTILSLLYYCCCHRHREMQRAIAARAIEHEHYRQHANETALMSDPLSRAYTPNRTPRPPRTPLA
jgi:hypothetical protein